MDKGLENWIIKLSLRLRLHEMIQFMDALGYDYDEPFSLWYDDPVWRHRTTGRIFHKKIFYQQLPMFPED